MDVHRGGGKFIHLQPAAAVRGRVVAASVAGVADAQNRPVPGWDVPLQLAIRRHLSRQIDDTFLRDRLLGRELLRVAAEHLSVGADLALEVGESRALRRCWICEHRDVLVEAVVLLRARQNAGEPLRARNARFGEHDGFHSVLRLEPRPPGARPSGAVRERHLDSEALRLLVEMEHNVVPLGRGEHDRPRRDEAAHVKDEHAADADLRHRLEVVSDALLRHVAVHDHVIDVRPRRTGRRGKPSLQRLRTEACGNANKRHQQGQGQKRCF